MIDGVVGYVALDDVMQNRYVYSGGGGSSSGGGDWTPPAL